MTNGWRCCRVSLRFGLLVVAVSGALWWWQRQPKTDEELFRLRCSSCHELRVQRLCEFEPSLRSKIVGVMRSQHGADQVIDETEARRIENYLRERFRCQSTRR